MLLESTGQGDGGIARVAGAAGHGRRRRLDGGADCRRAVRAAVWAGPATGHPSGYPVGSALSPCAPLGHHRCGLVCGACGVCPARACMWKRCPGRWARSGAPERCWLPARPGLWSCRSSKSPRCSGVPGSVRRFPRCGPDRRPGRDLLRYEAALYRHREGPGAPCGPGVRQVPHREPSHDGDRLGRDFRFACPRWHLYTPKSRRAHEILFGVQSSSSRGRHLSPR